MISYLSIKNIALIKELNIEFKKGLNILSGETGAGKSIIIDSINFVLGDRADRSLIRYGETTAKVEVIFSNIKNFDKIQKILSDADIDGEDDNVIITRTMTNERSECRINRKIVNLSLLRNVVSLLVDTHSQNEHQTLLKTSNHLILLDRYDAEIEKSIINYNEILKKYYKIQNNLSQFLSMEERERQLDMLSYQIGEIEKANLKENEEDELKSKRTLFYNSQKISEAYLSASNALSGQSGLDGASFISLALNSLRGISQYDSDLPEIISRLESAKIEIDDIADTVALKCNNDLSDINIDNIEKRIEEIRLLKKKYGKTYEEINDFYINACKKSEFFKNSNDTIEKLTEEKNKIENDLCKKAIALHSMREKTAKKFCSAIMDNLSELGMKNADFKIKFNFDKDKIIENLNQYGAETIEFMLSPNLGEPLKPLSKIASGGEMSRCMLAIKNVIAEIDDVDTLIFDEIDTGISGVIAKVVARKLYDIAINRQVIAITHLPQLASMGDANFLIEKKVVDDKTLTFLKNLEDEDVYKEIMRLSGAVENSAIGFSNAVELKKQSDDYKSSKRNTIF